MRYLCATAACNGHCRYLMGCLQLQPTKVFMMIINSEVIQNMYMQVPEQI